VLPQLWEALEKRLDRELADDAASSSGSSSSDGDASDSGGEDDGSDITDDGRGGNEAAPQQGQQPEAGFQLFGCEPHAIGDRPGSAFARSTRECQAVRTLWPLA